MVRFESKSDFSIRMAKEELSTVNDEIQLAKALWLGQTLSRNEKGSLLARPDIKNLLKQDVSETNFELKKTIDSSLTTKDGIQLSNVVIKEVMGHAFNDRDDNLRISSIVAAELLEIKPFHFNRTIRNVIERYPDFDKEWIKEDSYVYNGKVIPFYSLSSNGLLFIWSRGPKPRRAEMRYRQIMIQVLLIERLRFVQTAVRTIYTDDVRRSDAFLEASKSLLLSDIVNKILVLEGDFKILSDIITEIENIIKDILPNYDNGGKFKKLNNDMLAISNLVISKWITRVGKEGKEETIENLDVEFIKEHKTVIEKEVLKHIDDKMFVHGKPDVSHESLTILSHGLLSEEGVKSGVSHESLTILSHLQSNEEDKHIKELVDSMGVTVTISTKKASEMFDIEHYDFLKACREVKEAYPEINPEWMFEDSYKDASGKNNTMYNLSSEGFILISQLIHSNVNEKTELFRNKLQHEIVTRLRFYQDIIHLSLTEKLSNIREFGKSARQVLTNAIDRASGPNHNSKKFLYSETTNIIYEILNLPEIYRTGKTNNRDKMPDTVLEILAISEAAIANYLNGIIFKDSKRFYMDFLNDSKSEFETVIKIWTGEDKLNKYFEFIKNH